MAYYLWHISYGILVMAHILVMAQGVLGAIALGERQYLVMADIVMAYMVLAHIVAADIVMAQIVMAHTYGPYLYGPYSHLGMAHIVVAHIFMAHILVPIEGVLGPIAHGERQDLPSYSAAVLTAQQHLRRGGIIFMARWHSYHLYPWRYLYRRGIHVPAAVFISRRDFYPGGITTRRCS